MTVIPFQRLRESDGKDWSYGPNFVDGAFRLFRVKDLLPAATKSAEIVLSEWRGMHPSNMDGKMPKYAAISHSWMPSDEVKRLSDEANRPLNVFIEEDTIHTISWHGLCQAARAAQHLQCDYIWLDLLCLHQTSAADKKLQIRNMSHIYENAETVIVMPGGVSAAQSAEIEAPWITRAWTLQEATLCAKTYTLILYPAKDPRYDYSYMFTWPQSKHQIENIEGDLALAELKSLVFGRGGVYIMKKNKRTGESEGNHKFEANCFGVNNPATTALLGVLERAGPR